MGQPIVHVEIMGKDSAKLQNFYKQLFDWKISDPHPDMGNYAVFDKETAGVGGGIGEDPDGKSRVTVYVSVPDLQKTLDHAVKMGGKIVMEPMEIPNVVTMAQFSDPNGNVIGLVKS